MSDRVMHPRLFEMLAAFYPALCTIQQATETRDAAGQPNAAWSNLAGHVDIECRIGPAGGGERKTTNQVYTVATHTIHLTGYYPVITAKMRAVVGMQAFDILLVANDGQSHHTKLVCQVVS